MESVNIRSRSLAEPGRAPPCPRGMANIRNYPPSGVGRGVAWRLTLHDTTLTCCTGCVSGDVKSDRRAMRLFWTTKWYVLVWTNQSGARRIGGVSCGHISGSKMSETSDIVPPPAPASLGADGFVPLTPGPVTVVAPTCPCVFRFLSSATA